MHHHPIVRSSEWAPRTLIHGDLSLKNMLKDSTVSPPSFVVLDWQLASVQLDVRDVSFFIEHSIDRLKRGRVEPELLDYYHSHHEARGVTGYSFAQLVQDYRRSVLVDMARFVAVGSAPRTTRETDAATDFNARNAIHG